ncbi:MAG: GNAT family N-acetyltransferase [Planctomycetota bacterium]|jgi:ribosomal protein S18 acetylase RimI-like enzyme|nr:GNAT family N-acetyltransferase [Planctomycetota bacterium]
MTVRISPWVRGTDSAALEEVADLWNRNAQDRHAFYPWTGALLGRVIGQGYLPDCGGRAFEARDDDVLVGFIHITTMREFGYPPAGSVEALIVDAQYRRRGIGSELTREALGWLESLYPDIVHVDAMGAWPCGHMYTVLADGSERSGVFSSESALYRLFERFDFEPVRKSLIMRVPTTRAQSRLLFGGQTLIERRNTCTWLDQVFRARELYDHNLYDRIGYLLSRAIFGYMPGESMREGKKIYSLFGVNTPEGRRNKGYASANLSLLLKHIGQIGGDLVELHVYADNLPALALYRRLGFKKVADSMMMHRRGPGG